MAAVTLTNQKRLWAMMAARDTHLIGVHSDRWQMTDKFEFVTKHDEKQNLSRSGLKFEIDW